MAGGWAGEVGRLCAGRRQSQPRQLIAPHHQRFRQHELVVHDHADRHEPSHTPRLGGGPVVKLNANQSYATDAASGAWFAERCAQAGVPVQHFVSRADLPCGSTIGPLTATRLGISTVDVGSPMLAMHSCRELASAVDVPLMVAALAACLSE